MKCKKCGGIMINNRCSNCGYEKFNINFVTIIGSLLIILSCGYFVYNAFIYKADDIEKETNKIVKKIEDDDIKEVETEKGIKTELTYMNHKITIPEEFIYNIKSDSLTIMPISKEWFGVLGITEGSYNKIKDSKNTAKEYFEKSGYIVRNYGVVKKGDTEWLTFELVTGTTKCLAAYTRLNTNETVTFVIEKNDSTFDYDILENLDVLIKNIK